MIDIDSGRRLGLLLILGATVAWSTTGFFARLITVGLWDMLFWRGLFGSAFVGLAAILFVLGSRLVHPAEDALVGTLDAPLAAFWVWLAFGEVPTTTAAILGGSIVLAALTSYVTAEDHAYFSSKAAIRDSI